MRKLITVILGVSVLVGVGYFLSNAKLINTKGDAARVRVEMVATVLEQQFRDGKDRFPGTAQALKDAIGEPAVKDGVLVDPWGNAMVIACVVGDCRRAILYSRGPNGIDESGRGDDIVARLGGR